MYNIQALQLFSQHPSSSYKYIKWWKAEVYFHFSFFIFYYFLFSSFRFLFFVYKNYNGAILALAIIHHICIHGMYYSHICNETMHVTLNTRNIIFFYYSTRIQFLFIKISTILNSIKKICALLFYNYSTHYYTMYDRNEELKSSIIIYIRISAHEPPPLHSYS